MKLKHREAGGKPGIESLHGPHLKADRSPPSIMAKILAGEGRLPGVAARQPFFQNRGGADTD